MSGHQGYTALSTLQNSLMMLRNDCRRELPCGHIPVLLGCCCHSYFKKKIEELLVKLLKLEPSERMTFQEFFDFVDDLVKSKLTVINVQDGVMIKTEFDKQLTYVRTYIILLVCIPLG